VRLARPQNGDLVARRLARLSYAVYGATTTPPDADWGAFDWVAYEHSLAHVPEMCWLAESVCEERIVFRCNNMDALATAVANGIGLGILPCLVGARHAGLRRLSGDTPVISREVWLVAPRELRHVPRINAVGDWLVERFRVDAQLFG
jgi:DNA-binding transcriptional LysR family regulator